MRPLVSMRCAVRYRGTSTSTSTSAQHSGRSGAGTRPVPEPAAENGPLRNTASKRSKRRTVRYATKHYTILLKASANLWLYPLFEKVTPFSCTPSNSPPPCQPTPPLGKG